MNELLGWSVLWTRPLWTDEISLTFIVSRTSTAQMIADISGGGDWAPPLLHLMLWSITRLVGPLTPVLLRSVSFACVALALVFVYGTLRRRFDRAPSGAGTLALAGHALVIAHAFEGRFYGPWLLFAAGFAWSLSRGDISKACFSILLCTIHWFGVLSLGLMCLGALASHGRRWRGAMRSIAPGAVGLMALLVCAPLLFAQRASFTGTWVPTLNGGQISEMTRTFWVSAVPVVAAVLLLGSGLRSASERAPTLTAVRDPGIAALCSLALMPLCLIVISVVLQPSMVPRYAIVAALAWAPLVAYAVQSLGSAMRGASAALLGLLVLVGFSRAAAEKRAYAELVRYNTAAFDEARGMHLPVVFQSLHTLFPVVAPQRSTQSPARYLDLADSTLASLYPRQELAWLRTFFRVERDIGRSQAKLFGFPAIATQAQLDTTSRFLLLASDASLPRGYKDVALFGKMVFPRHRVTRLGASLSLFELTNSPTSR